MGPKGHDHMLCRPATILTRKKGKFS
uniref:Uncharacterized protein n=1 Tax=Arundo donax TaxID=35708 RepID=A0A0A9F4V4_ARUDO